MGQCSLAGGWRKAGVARRRRPPLSPYPPPEPHPWACSSKSRRPPIRPRPPRSPLLTFPCPRRCPRPPPTVLPLFPFARADASGAAIVLVALASLPALAQTAESVIEALESLTIYVASEAVKMASIDCDDLDCDANLGVAAGRCGQHTCGIVLEGAVCGLGVAAGVGAGVCENDCKGYEINFDSGYWRTAPGTFNDDIVRQDICRYKAIATDTLPSLLDPADNPTGQATGAIGQNTYFGTTHGAYAIWPGRARFREVNKSVDDGCRPYDPRIRPWWAAATAGPKTVVLMLDVSASASLEIEGGGTRLELLKRAAIDIINSFSEADEVAVLPYSDEESLTCERWADAGACQIFKGTDDNLATLKNLVRQLEPLAGTDLTLGLDRAFGLLSTFTDEFSPEEACTPVVIILSDGGDCSTLQRVGPLEVSGAPNGGFCAGAPPESSGDGIRRLLAHTDALQKDLEAGPFGKRARIFTISIGETADSVLLRQIVCKLGAGTASRIVADAGLDPLSQVNFNEFLAAQFRPADGVGPGNVRWSNVYLDDGGLGEMITAAVTVWSGQGLVGVVGTDVTLAQLEELGSPEGVTLEQIVSEAVSSSLACSPIDIDQCSEQRIRGSRYACPSAALYDDEWWPLAAAHRGGCLAATGFGASSSRTITYTLVYGNVPLTPVNDGSTPDDPESTAKVAGEVALPIASYDQAVDLCRRVLGVAWSPARATSENDLYLLGSLANPDGSWVAAPDTSLGSGAIPYISGGRAESAGEAADEGGYVVWPVGSAALLGNVLAREELPRSVICASSSGGGTVCTGQTYTQTLNASGSLYQLPTMSASSSGMPFSTGPEANTPPASLCGAAFGEVALVDRTCADFVASGGPERTLCNEDEAFGENPSTGLRDWLGLPARGYAQLVCCEDCIPEKAAWKTALLVIGILLGVALGVLLLYRLWLWVLERKEDVHEAREQIKSRADLVSRTRSKRALRMRQAKEALREQKIEIKSRYNVAIEEARSAGREERPP